MTGRKKITTFCRTCKFTEKEREWLYSTCRPIEVAHDSIIRPLLTNSPSASKEIVGLVHCNENADLQMGTFFRWRISQRLKVIDAAGSHFLCTLSNMYFTTLTNQFGIFQSIILRIRTEEPLQSCLFGQVVGFLNVLHFLAANDHETSRERQIAISCRF